MLPLLMRLLLCCLLFAPVPGTAAPVPLPTGLLVDETGLLDPETAQALQQRLQAIQDSGRAQVAILVAAQTHGEPLADYTLQVAQAWQLGRAGRDDGLLVVVVPRENAARIEVGYGLEGAVPDLLASQWIDELLPLLRERRLGEGLHTLVERIDAALPAAAAAGDQDHILDQHPEWKLPFVLAIFSPFALFPLFMGRWGAWLSAPLFAAALGWAAWLLWASQPAAVAVGAVAFVLPLLWGLNGRRDDDLPPALATALATGNAAAVLLFFAFLLLFIGVGLWTVPEALWGGPLFAGAMALGLAAVLFPGPIAQRIMVVLRSYMHFLFMLALAYPTLMLLQPRPVLPAFAVAGSFTALVALGLYMDHKGRKRASLAAIALALVVALPVAVLMLVQAVLGEDLQTQLVQAAAGGGSLGGVLWWAARKGFFAALQIGLGGRFGGGGAEGRS